jgi:hypothetical protein
MRTQNSLYKEKQLESVGGRDLKNDLKEIVNEVIKPIMKKLGFKKQNYKWSKDGVEVSIYVFRGSSVDNRDFTVEIFGMKELWAKGTPRVPYMAGRRGGQYELRTTTDLNELKSQIKDDFNNIVVPLFETK